MTISTTFRISILCTFLSTITYAQDTLNAQSVKDVINTDIKIYTSDNDALIEGVRIKIPFWEHNRNIEIIDKATIQKLPIRTVNELLAYISGIDVRQRGVNGAQADIGIDGGGFDQTLILVNGIKMNDPQTGHNTMNIPIPLIAIERIEVLKGAAARIYGINAMMGVINIVTKTTNKNNINTHVYSGSSFRKNDSTGNTFMNYGAEAAINLNTKNISQLLALSHDAGNGYRYNTAFKNTKIYYQNNYEKDKLRISTTAGYINNDFGANSFYAAPADANSTENVQVFIAGISGQIKMNDKWKIEPNLQFRYAKDDYIFIRQNPSAYHNIHETNIVDASINSSYQTQYGVLGIGLNTRMEYINSNNLGKNNRNNTGMFVEYRFKTSSKYDITIGTFGNYNNVFGFKVYPGIDLGWQILPKLRLYGSIGSGQRIPTFTDLYYKGPSNVGNADLQPEWATTYEIGTKYRYNKLYASLSAFYRDGRDFIDWTRTDTTLPWMPQNYFWVRTFGINLNTHKHFHISNHTKGLLYLGYTYLNPQLNNDDNTVLSRYTINSLKHQWITRLNFTFYEKWDIALANRYLYRLNSNNTATHNIRNYNITDIRLGYQFKDFKVYIDASNLLNIQYIESGVVPMPGRWISLGVKWNLK